MYLKNISVFLGFPGVDDILFDYTFQYSFTIFFSTEKAK
jgi:hypothetical protein